MLRVLAAVRAAARQPQAPYSVQVQIDMSSSRHSSKRRAEFDDEDERLYGDSKRYR